MTDYDLSHQQKLSSFQRKNMITDRYKRIGTFINPWSKTTICVNSSENDSIILKSLHDSGGISY